MAILALALGGFAWILMCEPKWITNHWNHWLFGNTFDQK